MASQFQKAALRLVTRFGGKHTITLQRYGTDPASLSPDEVAIGDPVTAPYVLGSYSQGEKDGIPAGTTKLSIAALSLGDADLSKGQWEIVATSNNLVIQPLELADIKGFQALMGGGAVAMYELPVVTA